jgi:arsenate reductase
MAAAWFNALADELKARAISAGTAPGARVHPEVVQVMQEAGIDLSREAPKFLSDELARSAALLVTMGCGEACPAVPGLRREDWPLVDPKGKPLPRVREIRDEIRARVEQPLRAEGWARRADDHLDSSIEPATARDLPAITQLLEGAGLPTVGVAENLEGFAVARRNDSVIGCGGVERYGRDGLLRSVAVAPFHRRRGVAAACVRYLVDRCARRGVASVYLLTATAPDYFARLGFEPCSRHAAPEGIRSSWEFRSGCPDTAVLMRLGGD